MKVTHNVLLSDYSSLKAGGTAKTLVEMQQGDGLAAAIDSHGLEQPIWVLGFGTNCLISDAGLPGTVIINRAGGVNQIDATHFKVDSGVNWDDFVKSLIGNGLWGLEFTSGIPGGVGAAIAGNIAAYGHKISDSFVQASMLDTVTGDVSVWDNDKFQFAYRSSTLQQPTNQHLAVMDAIFKLSLEPTGDMEYGSALKTAAEIGLKPDTLENRRKIIMETRQRAGSLLTDSKVGPWTAGSFFKNPVVDETQVQAIISNEEAGAGREQLLRQNVIHGGDKTRVSAAHVLLAAGFKRGQTWGNVGLHPKHVLKVENLGNATAQEIYDVVQHIIATVQEKLGIGLEQEVRFLGRF